MVLWELIVGWGKVGLFGFGGGPAMIPLMQAECVDVRAWVSEAEFLEALAASNALPGPITVKLSVVVGLKVGGPAGAAAALGAVTLPTAVLMLAFSGLLLRHRDNPAVAGAMEAAKPVVVGMLMWTLITLLPSGVTGWGSALIALVAMVALLLRVHPAIVVTVAMIAGALWLR